MNINTAYSSRTIYNKLQAKYPDAVIFNRVGDEYEALGEKAEVVSQIIGCELYVSTGDSVKFVRFPSENIDTYLPTIVRAGNRVAICDQMDEPKKEKEKKVDQIMEEATRRELNFNIHEIINYKSYRTRIYRWGCCTCYSPIHQSARLRNGTDTLSDYGPDKFILTMPLFESMFKYEGQMDEIANKMYPRPADVITAVRTIDSITKPIDAALDLIIRYVERGDDEESLRNMGAGNDRYSADIKGNNIFVSKLNGQELIPPYKIPVSVAYKMCKTTEAEEVKAPVETQLSLF